MYGPSYVSPGSTLSYYGLIPERALCDKIVLSPGLFVRENNKWGKIDEFGNIIIPIKYEWIDEVIVDRTIHAKRDGRYFLLEKNDKEIETIGVSPKE